MPRGKKRRNAAFAEQQPDEIIRPDFVPFTIELRDEFRRLMDHPVMKRAWQNARTMKPSVMTSGLNGKGGKKIANNRFHEIRGWELFEAAIILQMREQPKRGPAPIESYPDAGRV